MKKNRALTNEQAEELRNLYQEGYTGEDLATRYGVSFAVIESIIHGETYKDAGGPILKKGDHKERRRKANQRRMQELLAAAKAGALPPKKESPMRIAIANLLKGLAQE